MMYCCEDAVMGNDGGCMVVTGQRFILDEDA